MPRRVPKKPDPSLDLSGHLLRLGTLLEALDGWPAAFESAARGEPLDSPGSLVPLDPQTLFPGRTTVELEIGSGKGLFLASAAAGQRETGFLGVELAYGYARLTAARVAKAGLDNARVIAGDATLLVRSVLADASLAAVHIYFPDPWWKARHHKRRIMRPPLLRAVARVLAAGGRLHFWTDVEAYHREGLEAAAATGFFSSPIDEPPPAGTGPGYRTHFERRTQLAGGAVWRSLLIRNDATAIGREPPDAGRLRRAAAAAQRPARSTSPRCDGAGS
jgi:tRNA (guanine-N7-)-methyltransferase